MTPHTQPTCSNKPCTNVATHVIEDNEHGDKYPLCALCADAFNWGTTYPDVTAVPINETECPRCHNHVTGTDSTSVADRGYCLECHAKWQHGDEN